MGVANRGHWAGLAAIALAAGAVLPLALAPFALWPLMLASAAALFGVLRRVSSARSAFWHGWLFGVGKYGVGASWIYVSIHVYGAAAPPLAAGLVALFVAGLALFPALMAWAHCRLRREGAWAGLQFALLWVAAEWVLTWLLSGFPWLFAGDAFLETPLAGWAPVGGVLLVSLIAVGSATLMFTAVAERRWRLLYAPAALWAAGAALGTVDWTERTEARTVALVQGDLPQETKWTAAGLAAALARYEQLTAAAWAQDIVVWPEAALPALHRHVADAIDAMRQRAPAPRADLIHGALVAEPAAVPPGGTPPSRRTYNAALSTAGGEYRKRRLVPFGEYVPLESILRGLIAFFDLPTSHMSSGSAQQPALPAAGLEVAIAICYEIAYPAMVAAQARDAALLATISNDTWFGASIGPAQHLQIARMRALENGRYLLRATNNGITAIVDERGQVVNALPQFRPGVLFGTVYATAGATPYARFGNALVLGLLALGALAAAGQWGWRRWRSYTMRRSPSP